MSGRGELRAAMKAQRQALEASARALRERMSQLPQVQAAARRRRLRSTFTLAALLLVLCFIECDCDPRPGQLPEPVDAGVLVVEAKKPAPLTVKPVKKPPLKANVSLGPRDSFGTSQRPPPDWLDGFRLQVAARSPRLAECFQGTERPGALRWATAVNPDSGAVSDQTFEPVGIAIDLTKEQQTCLARVLSSPPYKVGVGEAQALPRRVSLVIEF